MASRKQPKKQTTQHRRERDGNEFLIEIRYTPYERNVYYNWVGDYFEYLIFVKHEDEWIELTRYGSYEHSRYCFEDAQDHWDNHHNLLIRQMKRLGLIE
jgi:hypothetical protein